LKVGDKVLRSNGKWTRITRIEYETREITVYNFEVEGNHSYFVGRVKRSIGLRQNMMRRIESRRFFHQLLMDKRQRAKFKPSMAFLPLRISLGLTP
jgi:hypothetical protein